jgi:hypothetical protein
MYTRLCETHDGISHSVATAPHSYTHEKCSFLSHSKYEKIFIETPGKLKSKIEDIEWVSSDE